MVGPQGDAGQELVAEPVLEGAVEVGGAAVGTQHLEVPQLRLPVHEELRFPAVDAHQHGVHHVLVRVAGHQLVGDAVGEELQGERGGRGDARRALPRRVGTGGTPPQSSWHTRGKTPGESNVVMATRGNGQMGLGHSSAQGKLSWEVE